MLKFIKNFIVLSISTGIINIIQIITNAYITQKIGTTVLGNYSLISNFFNFLVTISLFGIPLAITKIVSEKDAQNDNFAIALASKIGCRICALISVIVCIITIVFKDPLSNIFLKNIDDNRILILLALSLPFMAISSCICGYFNALRKVNKPVVYELISHIIQTAVIITLLNCKKPTFISFGLSILISEIISFIYSYIMYKKDLIKLKKSRLAKESLYLTKNILTIAVPISFTSFVRSALSTLKHTLIPIRLQKSGFSYDFALSRYGLIHGIALPFILIPSIFINCFSSLLLPEYSRFFATNDKQKIQKATEKIFKLTLIASLYISFIIFTSSDILCYFIYKNTEVSYYVKVLTPLICIMYLDFIVDNMLRGLDLQVDVMKINILDVVMCIILIYFGVPILGTFGYILVIYASEYLNGLLSINLLLKKINMKFKYLEWVVLPTALLFISFFTSNFIFSNTQNLISLILNLSCFSVMFFILFLCFKRNKI